VNNISNLDAKVRRKKYTTLARLNRKLKRAQEFPSNPRVKGWGGGSGIGMGRGRNTSYPSAFS
jgi:hypothetical protein